MRYTIILILALGLIGCQSGPGGAAGCDDCAVAEANPTPGGNAAAAAATGGQRANQAPFSGESGFAPKVKTTVGRGTGATTSSSSDSEVRHTSSGGAQNLALLVPTSANAGVGGTSASVVSAQRVVDSYLAALQLAMAQGADPEQIRFLSEQVARAQTALATAEAGSRANITYNMGGDNKIIGYSRAGTGVTPDTPEAMETLRAAADQALSSERSEKPSAAPEVLDPPAGAGSTEFPKPAPEVK